MSNLKTISDIAKIGNTISSPSLKQKKDSIFSINETYYISKIKEVGIIERDLVQMYANISSNPSIDSHEKEKIQEFIVERLEKNTERGIEFENCYFDEEKSKRHKENLKLAADIFLGFLEYVVVPIATVKILADAFSE